MMFSAISLKRFSFLVSSWVLSIWERQDRILLIRFSAIRFRCVMRSLVSTEFCMPEVEETYFCLSLANSISTFMFFSLWSATTVWDMHFLLSSSNKPGVFSMLLENIYSLTPVHRTRPPQIDREALPDPNRANYDSYSEERTLPNSPFKAAARQARPEADDAIPEAVGKEFTDLT